MWVHAFYRQGVDPIPGIAEIHRTADDGRAHDPETPADIMVAQDPPGLGIQRIDIGTRRDIKDALVIGGRAAAGTRGACVWYMPGPRHAAGAHVDRLVVGGHRRADVDHAVGDHGHPALEGRDLGATSHVVGPQDPSGAGVIGTHDGGKRRVAPYLARIGHRVHDDDAMMDRRRDVAHAGIGGPRDAGLPQDPAGARIQGVEVGDYGHGHKDTVVPGRRTRHIGNPADMGHPALMAGARADRVDIAVSGADVERLIGVGGRGHGVAGGGEIPQQLAVVGVQAVDPVVTDVLTAPGALGVMGIAHDIRKVERHTTC